MDKRGTREQRDEKSSPLFVAKSAQLLGPIVITLLPHPIRRNPRGPSSARLLLLVTVPNAMYRDAALHATSLLYVLLMVMDADATNSYFTYQGLLPETTHHVPTNNNARDLRCSFAADPAQNRSLHKTYRTEIIVSRRIPVIVYARSYCRTN